MECCRVSLTYEISRLSAMLPNVRSDVGKQRTGWKRTSISRCRTRFHTRQGSEVETFEVVPDPVDSCFQSGVFCDCLMNFFETMNYCGVIASSKSITDFYKLGGEEFSSEVHGDLAWGC